MALTISPLVLGLAALGLVIGLAADRLAARWPAHADGSVRVRDWRTLALAVGGALAFGALGTRWSDPLDLLILGVYFAVLLVLMATDLDQKLLPDVLTLPLLAAAVLLTLTGLNPLLADKEQPLLSATLAGLGAPLLLFVLDRVVKGALGMGDLKLVAGLGFMSGVTRLFSGLIAASILSAVVLLILIAARRLTLRTAIPFGPILIVGGMLAALAP